MKKQFFRIIFGNNSLYQHSTRKFSTSKATINNRDSSAFNNSELKLKSDNDNSDFSVDDILSKYFIHKLHHDQVREKSAEDKVPACNKQTNTTENSEKECYEKQIINEEDFVSLIDSNDIDDD